MDRLSVIEVTTIIIVVKLAFEDGARQSRIFDL